MAGKKLPEINASSMADIAFLLLIFFLVTTTIEIDKGILHKLPAWDENPPEPEDVDTYKRNLFEVLINKNDVLLINSKIEQVDNVRSLAKEFIDNRKKNPKLSDSPDVAVVSLQNDRGTSYGIYLEVQNELKAAYRELRDAYTKYQMTFAELKEAYDQAKADKDQNMEDNFRTKMADVTDEYPMRLSEAEPKEIGG